MRSDDQGASCEGRNLIEHALPGRRMVAHDRPFFFGEGAGLEEDDLRRRDLTDIVQDRAELYKLRALGGNRHRDTQTPRPFAGSPGMATCGGVALTQHRQQRACAFGILGRLLRGSTLIGGQRRYDFRSQYLHEGQMPPVIDMEPGCLSGDDMHRRGGKLSGARGPEPASLSRCPITQTDRLRQVYGHAKPIEQRFDRPFQARVPDQSRVMQLLNDGSCEAR